MSVRVGRARAWDLSWRHWFVCTLFRTFLYVRLRWHLHFNTHGESSPNLDSHLPAHASCNVDVRYTQDSPISLLELILRPFCKVSSAIPYTSLHGSQGRPRQCLRPLTPIPSVQEGIGLGVFRDYSGRHLSEGVLCIVQVLSLRCLDPFLITIQLSCCSRHGQPHRKSHL